MFYSGTLLRTTAWDKASQIALRDFSKEVSEEPEYIGVYAGKGKKMQTNIKKLLLTTKSRYLK